MSQQRPVVAYYRVSTDLQGRSGLGLEAQRAAVAAYCTAQGAEIVAHFEEVESGKRTDRPQLLAAIELAKERRAVLVIAKLDRLARDAGFIINLMKSGVEFVACDMPLASKFTIHILAAVAEHERDMISERTKAALKALKARGVRLGSPRPEVGSTRAAALRRAEADQRALAMKPLIDRLRARGITTLAALAEELNFHDKKTPRGRPWTVANVWWLVDRLKRIKELEAKHETSAE